MNDRSSRSVGLTADIVFVGLTRPAMAFGVPYAALLVNSVATIEAFLLSKNLLALLLFAPLHALARLASTTDPRFFELWTIWASRAVAHRLATASYWRARTLGAHRVDAQPWVRP
jgi:type IV secretion system protein VirB3